MPEDNDSARRSGLSSKLESVACGLSGAWQLKHTCWCHSPSPRMPAHAALGLLLPMNAPAGQQGPKHAPDSTAQSKSWRMPDYCCQGTDLQHRCSVLSTICLRSHCHQAAHEHPQHSRTYSEPQAVRTSDGQEEGRKNGVGLVQQGHLRGTAASSAGSELS